MQPLVTQQGAYQTIPVATGGGGGVALVSAPGVHAGPGALTCERNTLYTFDGSTTFDANLPTVGLEDGDLVAFQPDPTGGGGGVVSVQPGANTVLGIPVVPLAPNAQLGKLATYVFRWNAEQAWWEIPNGSTELLLDAVITPSMVRQGPAGDNAPFGIEVNSAPGRRNNVDNGVVSLPRQRPWDATAVELVDTTRPFDGAGGALATFPPLPEDNDEWAVKETEGGVAGITLSVEAGKYFETDAGALSNVPVLTGAAAYAYRRWKYYANNSAWLRV
jgi:hypothetical protein